MYEYKNGVFCIVLFVFYLKFFVLLFCFRIPVEIYPMRKNLGEYFVLNKLNFNGTTFMVSRKLNK